MHSVTQRNAAQAPPDARTPGRSDPCAKPAHIAGRTANPTNTARTPQPAVTRNRHTPLARLDATLDITLSAAAVATLATTLAIALPLPWRVDSIRPVRRDTAAIVSLALPRTEAAHAMHVVMQSLPEAEFGVLRLRPTR